MDRALAQYAHSFINRVPVLDGIAVFFAEYLPYCLIIAFVIFIFTKGIFGAGEPLVIKKRRVRFILATFLAVLIARGAIAQIIYYSYGRARPFAEFGWQPLVAHAASPSFPSGHALFFFALATSVWFVNKKWGWWFFAAAALIAVARVYALLHFPTDVIFGAVIGSAVAYAVFRFVPSVE